MFILDLNRGHEMQCIQNTKPFTVTLLSHRGQKPQTTHRRLKAVFCFISENGRVEQVHSGASGGGGVRRGRGRPARAGAQRRGLQRTDRPAGPNRRPRREPEGRLPVEDRPLLQRHQQFDHRLVVVLWTTCDVCI